MVAGFFWTLFPTPPVFVWFLKFCSCVQFAASSLSGKADNDNDNDNGNDNDNDNDQVIAQ